MILRDPTQILVSGPLAPTSIFLRSKIDRNRANLHLHPSNFDFTLPPNWKSWQNPWFKLTAFTISTTDLTTQDMFEDKFVNASF